MLDFDHGATSKFDDVLSEHGGLLHVLPPAVHLNSFFASQVGGNILSKFYSLGFVVGPLLHEILVSAQGPLVLVLRLRVWGQGLTILNEILFKFCFVSLKVCVRVCVTIISLIVSP